MRQLDQKHVILLREVLAAGIMEVNLKSFAIDLGRMVDMLNWEPSPLVRRVESLEAVHCDENVRMIQITNAGLNVLRTWVDQPLPVDPVYTMGPIKVMKMGRALEL